MKKSELIRHTVEVLNSTGAIPKRARKYSFEIVKRVVNGYLNDPKVLIVFQDLVKSKI
jgi:hypothetical protein